MGRVWGIITQELCVIGKKQMCTLPIGTLLIGKKQGVLNGNREEIRAC